MGTAKRPKLATGYSGPRAEDRAAVSLDATCAVGDGAPFAVGVLDLDARGCRIRGFTAAATKVEPITLVIGAVGPLGARLRWAKRGGAGLKFDVPLSAAELADARASESTPRSRVVQLRRPVSDGET